MFIERLKRILAQSIKGILVVLLVLVFFSIFVYVLNAFFPSGTSLKAIITGQRPLASTDSPEQANRKLFVVHGEHESNLASDENLAAVLSQARNNVKSKRAEAIAWETAQQGKLLYDRDAVQTLDRSAATIRFDENTSLDLGANTLVIIKRLRQDPLFREKHSSMVLVDGELRGNIAESEQKSVHLEIDTPGAKVRTIKSPRAKGSVDLKVSVNRDKSSTIAVYNGSAEIVGQDKKVILEANQSTKVAPNQAPAAPTPLPDRVKLRSPSDSGLYYYRDRPSEIRFVWQDRPGATGYHFVLARDPSFHDIVTDEQLSKPRFIQGNLKKGTYFWKVSTLEKTCEGSFSETRQFRVVQDQEPPTLQVRFPPKTIHSESYTLCGKAEPGARVFVGGRRVRTTRTGEFHYNLKLRPGTNVIVVEAIDAVNNVAYRSQRVNREI